MTQPVTRPRKRPEGRVIDSNGLTAVIATNARDNSEYSSNNWSVGQLISIHTANVRVVGVLYRTECAVHKWDTIAENELLIYVELVGEVYDDEEGNPVFSSGLSAYPHLGALCHRIRHDDLVAIFRNDDGNVVSIGALSQNRDIPALISIDNMISRHFAVVGTTGVGKSTAVSLIIRETVEARPDIRVLILDPHNEFEHALPDKSIVIDEKTLQLPFWLYSLEELGSAIFNGRQIVDDELELLRELIIQAKQGYHKAADSSLSRDRKSNQLTADTPVPYRMSDLIKLLEERRGSLDAKSERVHLRNLLNRIQSLTNDPRYQFMFASKNITDNMGAILSRLFRVPDEGCPVAILQLAGIPSEVVNATVSVLSRLAFDLAVWSHSRIKTLIVCEEAHRYIPADTSAGFEPTRLSIARIAKEGRKYGVHLGVITQRPSELDPTILSQCNTFFAMRLGNEIDQEIVRKAIPGGASSFVNFVPSLANREAIAFGQGASTPMRMIFDEVPQQYLPGNEILHESNANQRMAERDDLTAAIAMMRRMGGDSATNTAQQTEQTPTNPIKQREASGTSAKPNTNPTASFYKPLGSPPTKPLTDTPPMAADPAPLPQSDPAPPPKAFTPAGPLQRPSVQPPSNAKTATRNDLNDMMEQQRAKRGILSSLISKD